MEDRIVYLTRSIKRRCNKDSWSEKYMNNENSKVNIVHNQENTVFYVTTRFSEIIKNGWMLDLTRYETAKNDLHQFLYLQKIKFFELLHRGDKIVNVDFKKQKILEIIGSCFDDNLIIARTENNVESYYGLYSKLKIHKVDWFFYNGDENEIFELNCLMIDKLNEKINQIKLDLPTI